MYTLGKRFETVFQKVLKLRFVDDFKNVFNSVRILKNKNVKILKG